jgi:hypothetical protein
MDISHQEAVDILRKWHSEERRIWATISLGKGIANATLFGIIRKVTTEAVELNATGLIEEPMGNKTNLKIELPNCAFDFSDWREAPADLTDSTKEGFDGILMIKISAECILGLWAFKLFVGEQG